MALDTASEGNFNTRNPQHQELIKNLASSKNTKNTDFDRRKSAAFLGKEQMDEVKAKLDNVHRLLRKLICLVEDVEAVDGEDDSIEEDVNFISRAGFQRFGNERGNRNFFGQRSYFNQNSEKPFNNNYNNSFNNNMSYGNSSYQNPLTPTQESKIETMLDQVFEGQQKLTVDFNGKIDVVYTNLNTK
ncbi:hypothetical protein Bca52824_026957 [Brassica carinata]|uniref:Uncharacterized protein n=1 Tax=Brassica carinata TaxID=52824 RepID=A0A8X7SLE0_BRACI|nr:hypothetical protein Bca52824_026957 [Brassica carinata]